MTASMHCPRMKREKQSLVMLHACSTRRRRSSPGMKLAAGVYAVLVKQQVQREHHAQQDRKRQTGHLSAGLRHDAQRLVGAAHGVQSLLPDGVPGGVVQDRDGLRAGKVRDGLRRHGRGFRYAGDDGGAHGLELAAHERGQRRKRQGDGGDGQDDADGAARFRHKRAVRAPKPSRLERRRYEVEQVCQHRADGQGLKRGPDGREDGAEAIESGDGERRHGQGGDKDKGVA